ncbi:5-dehydro-2-deoxygluconokinase [Anaerobranca californiensis DSM 14826]|jgi:2-dehydro-3-deoxygluconokinase|uniref:5-dehydro-2-deoxygluconokinase n=1 Tax=Anaerobranca californiensis DSM 14826 TaxID=1120989 RepID=A0A1M6K808_9FIRM|nr:sugar kinase [Anaerobranca californiensis]SHJ55033.1 5-dehydro-2-deoxygluconokinase [Anaerobranca californiensis DSM 14826]
MLDFVTLGETMVMMNPDESGSLKYIFNFKKQLGGAESNVAIGLSRLGFKTGWISLLGADPHGEYIKAFIQGEGVDTSQVKFTTAAPTGLFFKERREIGETKVYYYRKNSAFSTIKPEDLNEEYIAQSKYLHLTGITPALSDSCYQTVLRAIEIAKKYNVKISFDPNLRLKLWKNKNHMKEVILNLIKEADIVLPGLSEGQIIFDTNNPEEIAKKILGFGEKIIAIKLGPEGSLIADSNSMKYVKGFKIEREVDPVGAGDGFAAGFLAGLLKGYDLSQSALIGNAVGAFAVTVKGDVEGLPTMDELQIFMGEKEEIFR